MELSEEMLQDNMERVAKYEEKVTKLENSDLLYSLTLAAQRLATRMYLVRRDIAGFREHMRKAAQAYLKSLQLFIAGDAKVLTPMIAEYTYILNSLEACDYALARELAETLLSCGPVCARKSKDSKKFFECPRTHNAGLGYTLVGLLLGDDALVEKYLPEALARTLKPQNRRSWHGQAVMMEGIFKNDAARFDEGLASFVTTYHNYMKTIHSDYEHHLCVRGIALANLARHRGMKITLPESKYLPKELVG